MLDISAVETSSHYLIRLRAFIQQTFYIWKYLELIFKLLEFLNTDIAWTLTLLEFSNTDITRTWVGIIESAKRLVQIHLPEEIAWDRSHDWK